ncbi:MAG: acetyl-CoA carboxylase biotin carboxyl carrier protein [Alphaproteobacteria bacterium]|nr:acetyl-CoA carboxylase biotin carboxyl carrier protein [Alphaproteobacteria bacterium]
MADATTKDDSKIKLDGLAVKQLADILNDTGLTEIEYEDQGCRIRVVKSPPAMVVGAAAPAVTHSVPPLPAAHHEPAHKPTAVVTGHVIRSPMVGTAYLSGEPGSAPYVKVGDHVKAGDTLLINEAMKVMNPIKASHSGVVKDIMVTDANPVEFDEPLLVIE